MYLLYQWNVLLMTGIQKLCVIIFNNYLAVPTYNHMGANLFEPEYCDCDSSIGILL